MSFFTALLADWGLVMCFALVCFAAIGCAWHESICDCPQDQLSKDAP